VKKIMEKGKKKVLKVALVVALFGSLGATVNYFANQNSDKEMETVQEAIENAKKNGDNITVFPNGIVAITKETPVDADAEEAPKGEKKAIDINAAVDVEGESFE
jgi:hypothetical protein